jgi:hypothetical protein
MITITFSPAKRNDDRDKNNRTYRHSKWIKVRSTVCQARPARRYSHRSLQHNFLVYNRRTHGALPGLKACLLIDIQEVQALRREGGTPEPFVGPPPWLAKRALSPLHLLAGEAFADHALITTARPLIIPIPPFSISPHSLSVYSIVALLPLPPFFGTCLTMISPTLPLLLICSQLALLSSASPVLHLR